MNRSLVAGLVSAVVAMMPLFALGVVFAEPGDPLRIGAAGLGQATAAYYLAGAVTAFAGHRIARGRSLLGLVLLGMGVCALSLAVLSVARGYGVLPAMALGGVGSGLVHPNANLLLVHGVREAGQGVAFGLKQSSAPMAALLVGLVAPAITRGLPTAVFFVGFGALAALATGYVRRVGATASPPRTHGQVVATRRVAPLATAGAVREPRTPSAPAASTYRPRSVAPLALAAGLGAGSGSTLGAFLAASTVAQGHSYEVAVLTVSAASFATIVVRVASGRVIDRWNAPSLGVTTVLFLGGAIGFSGLAVAIGGGLYLAAGIVAFMLGWGWPGALLLGVVRAHRDHAAKVTALLQGSIFCGAATLPALFGLVAEHVSYERAWLLSLVAALAAALLVVATRSSWGTRTTTVVGGTAGV